jgi:hypothetical protein
MSTPPANKEMQLMKSAPAKRTAAFTADLQR